MTIKATYVCGYEFGDAVAGQESFSTKEFDSMVDYQLWARKMDRLNAEYPQDRIHEIVSTEWDCK